MKEVAFDRTGTLTSSRLSSLPVLLNGGDDKHKQTFLFRKTQPNMYFTVETNVEAFGNLSGPLVQDAKSPLDEGKLE